MRWLGDVSSGRANNFNLIRMIAASSVLLSHSWPIALGLGTMEPGEVLTGYALGHLAVLTFFAISGFFICKSFVVRRSFLSFLAARVMRIYPGLLVVLLLSLLVLGPLFTVLSMRDYFGSPVAWSYVPRNLSLMSLQHILPGVFRDNPFGAAINGSLWTLIHEVLCYAMVVCAGVAGLLKRGRFPVFLLMYGVMQIVFAIAGISNPFVVHFAQLSVPFVAGMAFYIYRDRVPLSAWILAALVALAVLLHGSAIFGALVIAIIVYGSFWLGHVAWPGKAAYNRLGDYSYGMYIYAFPVQQTVVALMPGISPWMLALVSFPATVALSVLSWAYVEHPALEQREKVAQWLGTLLSRARPFQTR